MTSTEGTLTVVSCPSAPAGSPPDITTTGPKCPFFPRRNSRHHALPISLSASILLLGVFPVMPGPSSHENAILLIFKRMGRARSLQFSFLDWVSSGWSPRGCLAVSSKTQRPKQSLGAGRGRGPPFILVMPTGTGTSATMPHFPHIIQIGLS